MHDSESPGAQAFPSTRWSRLLTDSHADTQARRRALEALAGRYWLPICAYVRARWARSDDEAQEAAQEFFVWMMEGDLLSRADPRRGRFRGFIKRCLGNFLHDLERKRRTVKRGGTRRLLSFDEDGLVPELPDAAGRSPEELLDDLWRQELLANAAQGLQEELEGKGKARSWAVFRDYFLAQEDIDYAGLAARHGITTVDVSNTLAYVKNRYRAQLRRLVLETVTSDEDLRAELGWLFEEQST